MSGTTSSFEEWVQNDAQQPCVRKYSKQLLDLGTSWDSFRNLQTSEETQSLIHDLVTSGNIPVLAARDIVNIAKCEIQKSIVPMAIFWDIETMPVPTQSSGREVTSRLKSILAPYGSLVQFRAYSSIGLNLIPQHKPSDLQLSGCHLVDCPHNGRKEVADKMIIVDAMSFAYENINTGATLCFITGDVDYAYLLAVLQQHSQWRTIVISKGTMSSMLHVNCDMRMRWETDILQLRSSTATNNNVIGGGGCGTTCIMNKKVPIPVVDNVSKNDDPNDEDDDDDDDDDEDNFYQTERNFNNVYANLPARNGSQLTRTTTTEESDDDEDNDNDDGDKVDSPIGAPSSRDRHRRSRNARNDRPLFEPLTANEKYTDDVELLYSILRENGGVKEKGILCSTLRAINPLRFQSSQSVKHFLARTVDAGLADERKTGYGRVHLHLPNNNGNGRGVSGVMNGLHHQQTGNNKTINLSDSIPVHLAELITDRILQMSEQMPYILFAPKRLIPTGTHFRNYVQNVPGHVVLMFRALSEAQSTVVEDFPQLIDCTLIDWRRFSGHGRCLEEGEPLIGCCRCRAALQYSESIYKNAESRNAYCINCYEWDSLGEKDRAVTRVLAIMKILEENDDISVHRKWLKKQLHTRYAGICTTYQHAELWIDEAIKAKELTEYQRKGQKRKQVCLSHNLDLVERDDLPSTIDTFREERHVEDYLFGSGTWVTRKDVIESLKKTFPDTMQCPLHRARVFQNGCQNKRFYVVRGPYCQAVGSTEQEALEALEMTTLAIREELEWKFPELVANENDQEEDFDIAAGRECSDDKTIDSQAGDFELDRGSSHNSGNVVEGKKQKESLPRSTTLDTDKKEGVKVEVIISRNSEEEEKNLQDNPTDTTISNSDKEMLVSVDSSEKQKNQIGPVTCTSTATGQAESLISSVSVDEWDGESIDSADIDAHILSRASPSRPTNTSTNTEKD